MIVAPFVSYTRRVRRGGDGGGHLLQPVGGVRNFATRPFVVAETRLLFVRKFQNDRRAVETAGRILPSP